MHHALPDEIDPKNLQDAEALLEHYLDSAAMAADVAAHPLWGTYTPISDKNLARARMDGVLDLRHHRNLRSFRYTELDACLWARTSARALYAMGVRAGDVAPT